MTKRYDLTGVGSSLEFGKGGPVLTANGDQLEINGEAVDLQLAYDNGPVIQITDANGAVVHTIASGETNTNNAFEIRDDSSDGNDLSANVTGLGDAFFKSVTVDADPTAALEVATKQYVDAAIAGLDPKESCRIGTTDPINLATTGLTAIDGITPIAGDRVLVKDQTLAEENGLYVAAVGAWVRTDDADGNPDGEVSLGLYTVVLEGTTQEQTAWILATSDAADPDNIDVGTDTQNFVQFSKVGGVSAITIDGGAEQKGVVNITVDDFVDGSTNKFVTETNLINEDVVFTDDTDASGWTWTSTETDLDDGAGASNTLLPTQLAVKSYVDNKATTDFADVTYNTDADVSGNTWVLDEDTLGSDDATKVPTQQSVKAYVDTLRTDATLNADSDVSSNSWVDSSDALGVSDAVVPTQGAVKTYVDTELTDATFNTDTDVSGNAWVDNTTTLGSSDAVVPTQNAVKSYVDSAVSGGVDNLLGTVEVAFDVSSDTVSKVVGAVPTGSTIMSCTLEIITPLTGGTTPTLSVGNAGGSPTSVQGTDLNDVASADIYVNDKRLGISNDDIVLYINGAPTAGTGYVVVTYYS